jgi:putative endonuclease
MADNPDRLLAGQLAENAACEFLQRQGLLLIHRNYRCARGEIDLIMQDQAELVFVEVRVRNNTGFGSAAESVDHRKQQKIIATANHYLQQTKWLDKVNCRFDVIGISYAQNRATVEWIADAFSVEY